MNLLDVVLILLALAVGMRWAQRGLVRGVFSLLGFWLGLIVGAWVAPSLMRLTPDPLGKLSLALLAVLAAAFLCSAVGEYIAHKITLVTTRLRLEKIDSMLGALFGVTSVMLIGWLLAAMLSGVPYPALNRLTRDSAIIRSLDQTLPPAPIVLSRIGSIINPLGFPKVFIGQGPQPVQPVQPPSTAEVEAAVAAARVSTVRIEALGCGGISTGSGFVAADSLVVTNAHVVAGVRQLVAEDTNGLHRAVPVYFDPDLDIAILRVDNLAGRPLAFHRETLPRGTAAAVLGFPGGGEFTAVPAGVLRSMEARGLNIYSQRTVSRQVYELQADIEQGNSGGPVVLPDGEVIGIVFAKSQVTEDVGYAIAASQVAPLLDQAARVQGSVATGRCAG